MYKPRKLEEIIDNVINLDEIILVKGPRQSGKTTLFKHLSEKYKGLYLTLDDPEYLDLICNNYKYFIEKFVLNKYKYLFLDEAQKCKDIGKILKLIYDLYKNKIKIFVTGSGDFDIKGKISKYLVGRCFIYTLYPLSFEEFLMWKDDNLYQIFQDYKKSLINFILGNKDYIDISLIFTQKFKNFLEEFLIYGSYPKVVLRGLELKKETLRNLYITYLESDVYSYFNIFEKEKFEKLIKYLAYNIGSLLNISEISRDLGISIITLEKYISILYNTYIIYLLKPFFKNVSTEIKKAKKIYFIDLGLRNFILGNFLDLNRREDFGKLLENFVVTEFLKNFDFELYYWRTKSKAEVDLVIRIGDELIPIEVKTSGRYSKSLISFIKKYKPDRAIVFTLKDEIKIEKYNDTKILVVPHYFI